MLPTRILLMLLIATAIGFCAPPKERCTIEIREGIKVQVCRVRYANGKVCETVTIRKKKITRCIIERPKTR